MWSQTEGASATQNIFNAALKNDIVAYSRSSTAYLDRKATNDHCSFASNI